MSVAERLGLSDPKMPLLAMACARWPRWSTSDPDLAVVANLEDLPEWLCFAPRAAAHRVLEAMASLTATEPDAIATLAWLLLPGAEKIARQLADRHPDSEGLVGGQLWIEAENAHRLTTANVAAAILGRTRRAVHADLGIGDAGRRADRVWAESVPVHRVEDLDSRPRDHESLDELFTLIDELLADAMQAHAIDAFDAWLLCTLADIAARLGVPGHRGRMGLTAPSVTAKLAGTVHLSARALRRRATAAMDRIAEFSRVRDDPIRYGAWQAEHRSCRVTASEEMRLVIGDDLEPHFFRARDLPAADPGSDRHRKSRWGSWPATG